MTTVVATTVITTTVVATTVIMTTVVATTVITTTVVATTVITTTEERQMQTDEKNAISTHRHMAVLIQNRPDTQLHQHTAAAMPSQANV